MSDLVVAKVAKTFELLGGRNSWRVSLRQLFIEWSLLNRACRRCFLFGDDEVSGENFDHRRIWIEDYLQQFASVQRRIEGLVDDRRSPASRLRLQTVAVGRLTTGGAVGRQL